MQLYPTPMGATRSDRFEVVAEEREIFVERWCDVSYARFAMAGPVAIEIRAAGPVHDVRVVPRAAIAGLVVEGERIRFTLLRPANLVVMVAGMERLFVLADPVEPVGAVPVIGAPGVTSVVAYGAEPDGERIVTGELQSAIDDAAARGGGTVVVPAGTFVTGTLCIRSRVTLYLAAGAVLRGSAEPSDYPIDPGRTETGSDASIARADERYRGETMTFSRLIWFDGAEDAHLAGRGTIDGNGSHLRRARNAVPNLIRVRGGQRVTIRDVLLRDAAAWTLHILGARHVGVENVKIINDRGNLNTDGIDPDSAQDVAVRGCLIYTKDDAVCVKATNNSDVLQDVARIEVTGNVVSSLDAALKVGTESLAARFTDIVFRDNDVLDSGRAVSIVVRDGATYERIAFRDIRVAPGVRHLIEQVVGVRDARAQALGLPMLGRIEQLVFEDIDAPGFTPPASNRTWYTQFRPGDAGGNAAEGAVAVFAGADAAHAVRGLVLRNVVVRGERLRDREAAARVAGLTIGPHVDDVTIE
ncbi:MAG TPA: glycosyl hydrolase family 28 protein [Kofleriaceae bacterium]|nr:glycosyl hydrolase family 28 protein [Kofleriaceae bacterium]